MLSAQIRGARVRSRICYGNLLRIFAHVPLVGARKTAETIVERVRYETRHVAILSAALSKFGTSYSVACKAMIAKAIEGVVIYPTNGDAW
jgi:hypothetical protein